MPALLAIRANAITRLFLKIKPQRKLPRSVPRRSLRQRRLQYSKCIRIADVRRGRREIRAVQHIGERRLKAQMKPFSELELFGQARVDAL
jgi:hypothetical protein